MEAVAVGHNNPPSPAEQFRFEVDTLKEKVSAFPEIDTENAGEANDLIRLCGNLAKEIDKTRKAEKQPHLDAGRAVDNTYMPLADEAKKAPDGLKARLSAHLREQERIAREAAAEAARIAEEERLKAEAEKAVSMPADEAEIELQAEIAEIKATAAAAEAEKARTAKGSQGLMASGLRTKREVVVTDPIGLVRHFHKHPEVVECCLKLAKAQVRAARGGDVNIEGIAIKEVREL
jgi:hypothetical protein